MSEYAVVRSTVTKAFLARLRREAPRFMEDWGFMPGEDGQLLLAAAGAYLAIADYLAAAADAEAVHDGMCGLFPETFA